MQLIINNLTKIWFAEEIFHYIQSFLNRTNILQREHHPTTKHSSTHRSYCSVYNIEKRTTILLHCAKKFQRTNGKPIQTHVFLLLNSAQRGDVVDMSVLRYLKILHNSSRSNNAILQVINTKALQTLCTKMLKQFLACSIICENPVIKFKGTEFITEIFLEIVFFSSIE